MKALAALLACLLLSACCCQRIDPRPAPARPPAAPPCDGKSCPAPARRAEISVPYPCDGAHWAAHYSGVFPDEHFDGWQDAASGRLVLGESR